MKETDEGVILPVKVIPKAGEEKIVGWHEGRLKIKVCAPPEKGKANRAIIRLLAKALKIPPSRIILLKGKTSHTKDFLLIGYHSTSLNFFSFPNQQ